MSRTAGQSSLLTTSTELSATRSSRCRYMRPSLCVSGLSDSGSSLLTLNWFKFENLPPQKFLILNSEIRANLLVLSFILQKKRTVCYLKNLYIFKADPLKNFDFYCDLIGSGGENLQVFIVLAAIRTVLCVKCVQGFRLHGS